ncbi:uncharacterized protein LOC131938152 [Physella acuta]|uniref:uncharacterized protein LOC131938152 n=1 Tax=Physella acuta TaxID=109671 RepID=UPI0027DB76BC|nr:uncharacterized protein LOC131938152 [Physella acuta]
MTGQETKKIFVVGRGENGKTMTTQTIVGENSKVVYTSGTINVISSADDKVDKVEVADGTGVGEPLEDLTIDIGDIIKSVDDVMVKQFINTLTAIVLVLKYGVRFTMQEKKSLHIVKDIFGQDVMKRRGVVVITYGDNFYKENDKTFQEWCREQTGDFRSLMEECNYRCVLFDNRDGSKRESQVKEFMATVAQIDATIPYKYTPDKNSREKLINEYKKLEPVKAEERHNVEKPKDNCNGFLSCIRSLLCYISGCFCRLWDCCKSCNWWNSCRKSESEAPKQGDSTPKETD